MFYIAVVVILNHTAKNILIGTAGAAGLFLASAATANADTAHKVVKNDTVWDLSQKYGVSIESIETLNKIDQNSHLIVTGQTLQIPAIVIEATINNVAIPPAPTDESLTTLIFFSGVP